MTMNTDKCDIRADLATRLIRDCCYDNEMQAANRAIDEAGLRESDISLYIIASFAKRKLPVDFGNMYPLYFVYEYIQREVSELLDTEIDFDFISNFYISGNSEATAYHWTGDYNEDLLQACAKIENKPQFLKWFIEHIQ